MYEIKLLYDNEWLFVARFKTPSQARDKINRLIQQGHSVEHIQLIKRQKIRA